MPYKLYIVSLVAFFDAVYADGVPVRRVTGMTSGGKKMRWNVNLHDTVKKDKI